MVHTTTVVHTFLAVGTRGPFFRRVSLAPQERLSLQGGQRLSPLIFPRKYEVARTQALLLLCIGGIVPPEAAVSLAQEAAIRESLLPYKLSTRCCLCGREEQTF